MEFTSCIKQLYGSSINIYLNRFSSPLFYKISVDKPMSLSGGQDNKRKRIA